MRNNFIVAMRYENPAFPNNFSYNSYLGERAGNEVAEIVEVPVRTWLALQGLLCLFLFVLVAIDDDKQKLIWIWLTIDWLLLFLYIYIWRRLNWIRKMLGGHGKFTKLKLLGSLEDHGVAQLGELGSTKRSPKKPSGHKSDAELVSPLIGDSEADCSSGGSHSQGASGAGFFKQSPKCRYARDEAGEYRALYLDPELNNNKRKRSCLQKLFPKGDQIPNLHENLFWEQKHGKMIMRQLIRWILLNNAIYLAFFFYFFIPFVLNDSDYEWWTKVFFFCASSIPPFMTVFLMTPMTLRSFVHMTAIEMMKNDHECCKDRMIVLSRQKARKTITMLKMIETMESSVRSLQVTAHAIRQK